MNRMTMTHFSFSKSFLTLSLTGLSLSSAWALNIKDVPIQHVTVYPNGALIERQVPVRAGEKLITLEGLPANFDIAALKVQSQNIDVTAVTHLDSALNKPSGRESAQLKQHIKQLEQQIAKLSAQIQAAELQNKFLGNVTTGNASTVRQQAYDAFLTISNASQEKQELEQRLAELNQDLAQIGDHQFNQRSLQLHTLAPQNGQITLAYQVPYATWRPSYKSELNSRTQQMTLTRMAMIAQKTGEDWDNVQITLSTNTPKGVVQQVEPSTWLVDYDEPNHDKAPVVEVAPVPSPIAPMAAKMSYADRGAAPAFPQFEPVQQTYSTQFTTTTRTSIPSSSQQISLPLDQQNLNAQLTAWVIPQQRADRAFLSVETDRVTGDWPSGLMKLYRDGDYIGQRQWQNPTGDKMHFNFGEDEQLQVTVKNLPQKRNDAGSFSKSVQTTQSKQYLVKNHHQQAVDLIVFESLPQSQNSALKVSSQFSQQPTQTSWEGTEGIYQWRQQLAPQQSFDLNIEYQFKHPSEGYASGF